MSFESGSMSFRIFYVPRELPRDVVTRFARHALPPIEALGRGEIHGWVTGRHLLDRDITEESAYVAGYLRLALVKAERRIPAALLRTECRIQELAVMQAQGRPFLTVADRTRIRKEVTDRLLPHMPPTLTAIPMVYHAQSRLAYAGATSEPRADAFLINFEAASGCAAVPLDATVAAKRRRKVDVTELPPVSFSPELDDTLAGTHPGQDFFTWLWFHSEARGGLLHVEGDTCAVAVDGPISLFLEGQGAHIAVLRRGAPLLAAEAKTSLLSGKKLWRARLTVSRAKETWTVTFDARDFVFLAFRLPKPDERLDAITAFQQRMLSLDRFVEAFFAFYDQFLEERVNASTWKSVQKDIHRWVRERVSKH